MTASVWLVSVSLPWSFSVPSPARPIDLDATAGIPARQTEAPTSAATSGAAPNAPITSTAKGDGPPRLNKRNLLAVILNFSRLCEGSGNILAGEAWRGGVRADWGVF